MNAKTDENNIGRSEILAIAQNITLLKTSKHNKKINNIDKK
jgi:hypothetical protein